MSLASSMKVCSPHLKSSMPMLTKRLLAGASPENVTTGTPVAAESIRAQLHAILTAWGMAPGLVRTTADVMLATEHERPAEHSVTTFLTDTFLGWLDGLGAVAIDNLMEDAATAEISRAQLWQWLHFGGQVMKNVAGYDVSRLMVGAMGILGVLSDVSIKVLPRAVATATLRFESDEAQALGQSIADRLLSNPVIEQSVVRVEVTA